MGAIEQLIEQVENLSQGQTMLKVMLSDRQAVEVRVTVREAARLESCDERTIRRWIQANKIKHGYDRGRYVVVVDGKVKRKKI